MKPNLRLVYPPPNYATQSPQIFLLGTAPTNAEVRVNGQLIRRSQAGHFAPSFPLALGLNRFQVIWGDREEQIIEVQRLDSGRPAPQTAALQPETLSPAASFACLPGEAVCFSAVGTPGAQLRVWLADKLIELSEIGSVTQLPPNTAVLTGRNQPQPMAQPGLYQGWGVFCKPGNLGCPRFELAFQGETITQQGGAELEVLDPAQLPVIEVQARQGQARTGPGQDYARLTPLPQGTQATVSGRSGTWLRLDYGGWLLESEVSRLPRAGLPHNSIRSISASCRVSGWTEVRFPLALPVPVSVRQEAEQFWLTLHNTVAQTDTIRLEVEGLLDSLTWQQLTPLQVQYCLRLRSRRQWGYRLRYEGSTLILGLRHPSQVPYILLDPGHGGPDAPGARGPDGSPEKDFTLALAQQVRDRLVTAGLQTSLTRDADMSLSLQARTELIEQLEPTLCLSLHYNALPDEGDAETTQGLSAFWYHPQSLDLARFVLRFLCQRLGRESHGLYWGNLALTRPSLCPAVLLELGFLIHPEEFEWISDSQAQAELAEALAEAVLRWLEGAGVSGSSA